eukprot:jgi/Botrbrau1/15416/Bobra.43_2s0042.1
MWEDLVTSWRTTDTNLPLLAFAFLLLVLATVLFLAWSRRKSIPPTVQGGTRYVTTDDGHLVRRSQRNKKEVTRWSPDDLGSPTGYKTPTPGRKVEQKDVKPTPTRKSRLAPETTEAAAAKGLKTPKASLPSVPSPRRTRRRAAQS